MSVFVMFMYVYVDVVYQCLVRRCRLFFAVSTPGNRTRCRARPDQRSWLHNHEHPRDCTQQDAGCHLGKWRVNVTAPAPPVRRFRLGGRLVQQVCVNQYIYCGYKCSPLSEGGSVCISCPYVSLQIFNKGLLGKHNNQGGRFVPRQ